MPSGFAVVIRPRPRRPKRVLEAAVWAAFFRGAGVERLETGVAQRILVAAIDGERRRSGRRHVKGPADLALEALLLLKLRLRLVGRSERQRVAVEVLARLRANDGSFITRDHRMIGAAGRVLRCGVDRKDHTEHNRRGCKLGS